jgi:antitoxin VapB
MELQEAVQYRLTNPCSLADSLKEVAEKSERIRQFLTVRKLSGLLLTRVDNFAWATAGMADNQIGWGSNEGGASLLYVADGRRFVLGAHSEIPRLKDEDIAQLGFEPIEIPWYQDNSSFLQSISSGRFASDLPRPSFESVDIAPLRYALAESEISRYRSVGEATAAAVVETALKIEPGMEERSIEAMTSDALMIRGLRPTVLLIGSDKRIFQFRHALPSNSKRVDKYAMVNVCAKKWGLVISITRLLHFGPMQSQLQDRYAAVAEINARYWNALKPGASFKNIFTQATSWYSELGYDGEWKLHHQGGPCGYTERDLLLHPDCTEPSSICPEPNHSRREG